jgi:hypothetical protein
MQIRENGGREGLQQDGSVGRTDRSGVGGVAALDAEERR